MKNYFNAEERTNHIIALAMQETLYKFATSDALSDEEKKLLVTAHKKLLKFNKLVFERMGLPYQRKIENTMQANSLRLVGKYASTRDCVSHSAVEDLEKALNDLRMFRCLDCTNCDYLNCGTYASMIACDINGDKTEGNVCPFRM